MRKANMFPTMYYVDNANGHRRFDNAMKAYNYYEQHGLSMTRVENYNEATTLFTK